MVVDERSNLPVATQQEFELSLEGLPEGMEIMPEYNHRFTGERVARNRERYLAIVEALAAGVGMNRVARMYKVSKHTLMAIREREPRLIESEKLRIARALMATGELCVETFREAVIDGKVKMEHLMIGGGICFDKAGTLMGDPNVRLEINAPKEVSVDDVKAYIASLRSADVQKNPQMTQISADVLTDKT